MKFIELKDGLLVRADTIKRVYVEKENIRTPDVEPDYMYDVKVENENSYMFVVEMFSTKEEALKKYNEIKEKLFTNN